MHNSHTNSKKLYCNVLREDCTLTYLESLQAGSCFESKTTISCINPSRYFPAYTWAPWNATISYLFMKQFLRKGFLSKISIPVKCIMHQLLQVLKCLIILTKNSVFCKTEINATVFVRRFLRKLQVNEEPSLSGDMNA